MKQKSKQKRGFTMIELLAVLVILGIIMVIAVPSVVGYLQGARNDYYDQLEESVKTVGQEYFSDHRSLMPRENGQIFSVDIQDLITEGYTTEILDSDGNDTCTGNVYVKRLATADFEYHACIQCGKTDAEGNQEYISTSAFCTNGTTGNNPGGTCDKPKEDPTDDCFMITVPDPFKVPQCTTVEDSAASQGISLDGIILNNGEDIGERITADTTEVKYQTLGTYKIWYTYKQVLNPANEKYNTNVTIYDDKAPSKTTVELHFGNSSGPIYNCTENSCDWTAQDVYITLSATDLSDCGTEGSGVKQFAYRYGESGNWQYVDATKTIENGKNIYKATIIRNETHKGILDIKAIDNATTTGAASNNEGEVTRVYLKVDKTPPTCVSSGGKTDWINASTNPNSITLTGTCTDAESGCKGNVTKNYTTDINSTTETPGTVYDNVGNSTVCPANQTVKIDKTAPSCVSSGGSSWTNKKITLTGTCNDNLSGCKSNITKEYSTEFNSTTETPGTVYDNAGNSVLCPANQTVQIDLTAPTYTITPSGTPHENGYQSGLVVNVVCSDSLSGIASGSQSPSLTSHGTNSVSGTCIDNAGNRTDYRSNDFFIYVYGPNASVCGTYSYECGTHNCGYVDCGYQNICVSAVQGSDGRWTCTKYEWKPTTVCGIDCPSYCEGTNSCWY